MNMMVPLPIQGGGRRGDQGSPTKGVVGGRSPLHYNKIETFFHTIWNSQYRHDEILDFSTLHYYS